MTLTVKDADREYKEAYAALLSTHGTHSSIPKDEVNYISELHRAKMVTITNGGDFDAQILSQYSVARRVIEELCGEVPEIQKKVRQADKRRAMEQFVKDNADGVVTPADLAEAGDVSYATAMKFINENPVFFTKVERGSYLIRDVEAERQAAREQAADQPRTVRRKR